MKRLLIACLALLTGVAAFAGPGKEKAQLTVQTASGPLTSSTKYPVMMLDPAANTVTFYFKTQTLTTGDKAKDAKILNLLQGDAYYQIHFKGTLQKNVADMKVGEHLSTSAVGTLQLMGLEQQIQVPVKVTRVSETEYAFSCSALLDWTKNKGSLAAGQSLKAQGPIRLELTHTL